MPLFKIKSDKKKKVEKTNVNIDIRHTTMMSNFKHNDDYVIPNLKKKKKKLKTILLTETNNENKMKLIESINNIKQEIQLLKKTKDEYLLNNSKYIFEYFENKKNISNNDGINNNNNNKINTFFKLNKTEDNIIANFNLVDNINNNVNKYLRNTDDTFLDIETFMYPSDICGVCFKGTLIAMDDEGVYLCSSCSKTFRCLIENEKTSYKEPPKEVCFYAYKKINHLKEILAQLQGKETTQIQDKIIENIKLQAKKERIGINETELTNAKTKEILKKLGYNGYYEHIPFIKNKLGIKPPIMSPELEDLICVLFIEIQAPYNIFCPDDKVNFLNYYYTVYKICELLGERKYLEYLQLLREDKINEQDCIWKKICKYLDWLYLPTIV
jgi:hypothetical protein